MITTIILYVYSNTQCRTVVGIFVFFLTISIIDRKRERKTKNENQS